MSWKLKQKALALLAEEEGAVRKDWGGRLPVALVYPNSYAVGMSNLGFQAIYGRLNALPDAVCERAFFPEPEDLEELHRTGSVPCSLESQRALHEFAVVGFSVTYEGDYVNVLRLLDLARIPRRAADRGPGEPLVVMGGVCAFSNPEPLAPFMDAIVVGEGEEIVAELVSACRAAREVAELTTENRGELLDALAAMPGVYVPARYAVAYGPEGAVTGVTSSGPAPAVVVKRRVRAVDAFETASVVRSPRAEYGHLALLEVGKGCGRGCRFCLEGQVYRPVRHRSVPALTESVRRLAADPANRRIGLVGACVSDYPWITELLDVIAAEGLELSISSLRADSLTEGLVAALARGGHRTLTIAAEAGTERLRQAIRKPISDAQILEACALVRRHGIPNLKAYFMLGLPTEDDDDVAAIPLLARRMLERLRALDPAGRPFGRLTLSISSFVPKPWTPFQWAPFAGAPALESRLAAIKRGVQGLAPVRVLHENPREAALQALLARGDRRVAEFLELAADAHGDWRRAWRAWGRDPGLYTTRLRPVEERLPWDHFEVGVRRDGLRREWERALALAAEPPAAREVTELMV